MCRICISGGHKVQCTDDLMKVDIVLSEDNIKPSDVYLEGMKGYPNPKCQPTIKDHEAQFVLSLRDFYECGVTRIVYKLNVSRLIHLILHGKILIKPLFAAGLMLFFISLSNFVFAAKTQQKSFKSFHFSCSVHVFFSFILRTFPTLLLMLWFFVVWFSFSGQESVLSQSDNWNTDEQRVR